MKHDSGSRRWLWRSALLGALVVMFFGGYLCGRVESKRKIFQRDLVYAAVITVATLVPVEVMERKHPGSSGPFVREQIDRALQEPEQYLGETELSQKERKMMDSAWQLATRYTGRERIRTKSLGFKVLPRRSEHNVSNEPSGSTNDTHGTEQMVQ